ncbi:MAG: hypothetical protein L3J87_03930 [Thermoplasmata archaeon]|nr:hypothetical protein [Thermoplasmata archaeon]
MPSDLRRGLGGLRALGVLAFATVLLLPAASGAPAYPVLPLATSNGFLAHLAVPVTAPGSSSSFTWTLHDPLPSSLAQVVVRFELYAFNAYPGNATGPIGGGTVPELSNGSGSFAGVVSYAFSSLASSSSESGSTQVLVPTGTPLGDYAVRTSLRFEVNGTGFYLASRGFFSASSWSYATNGSHAPTGLPSLNVSRLNVSGVLPETAVTVLAPTQSLWIYGLLAGAIIAAGVGGYYGLRRGPTSSSGARTPPDESRADRAFGNNRTSDGD